MTSPKSQSEASRFWFTTVVYFVITTEKESTVGPTRVLTRLVPQSSIHSLGRRILSRDKSLGDQSILSRDICKLTRKSFGTNWARRRKRYLRTFDVNP